MLPTFNQLVRKGREEIEKVNAEIETAQMKYDLNKAAELKKIGAEDILVLSMEKLII